LVSGKAATQAARAVGSSTRSVERAKRVKEQAPDLADEVETAKITLDRAERTLRDRQAEERRAEQAREDEQQRETPLRIDVRLGDFREVLADVRDVDAVITDPPYAREWLPLLDDLASWSDRVLAPDGVLAVLFGQAHLPEVYRRLDGGRPYRWTLAYITPGRSLVVHHARASTNWKPVLLYGNGPRIRDTITAQDTIGAAQAHHEWGQDLDGFRELVRQLVRPGMTVADPFTGAGTTLIAAREHGCHVVGAEIDPDHYATTLRRLT
jgi:16S rRNA G966 N2-methylase RsmD